MLDRCEEHREETGEVVLSIAGRQPGFFLKLCLRRDCRPWQRKGYRVVRMFEGRARELVDRGLTSGYWASNPDARTVGAVLTRPRS
ncbi:MAG: hypothetical protein LC792_04945 [Actinobacteria bacterium]|nr:hypothetical protein [Actinomycetota bacterium]